MIEYLIDFKGMSTRQGVMHDGLGIAFIVHSKTGTTPKEEGRIRLSFERNC